MNPPNSEVSIPVLILLCVLLLPPILVKAWRLFGPRPSRGLHYSAEALQWAVNRYPSTRQPLAAFVATTIGNQTGLELEQFDRSSRMIEDLRMDRLEKARLVMATEENLGIKLSVEDCEAILTVDDLVSHLHDRLCASGV